MEIKHTEIGARIELLRIKLGYKKPEMGLLLGYDGKSIEQSYNNVKTGRKGLSMKALLKLKSNHTELNINWLIYGQGQMFVPKEYAGLPLSLEKELVELREWSVRLEKRYVHLKEEQHRLSSENDSIRGELSNLKRWKQSILSK